ncbi:MAG: hypothetical protein LBG48_01475 [Rickettsiales bacterium]|jgi:type II secretory pathway pseudopilin PulG|nr:hypothetical protein [Rickettsiales bacterium]
MDAIQYSNLPNADKYEIINNFKAGFKKAITDDYDAYNDLIKQIVEGDIIDNTPILKALAAGKIRETTKDALIQTLEQKQKPAYQVYQSAIKQLERVYNKGLLARFTPAESAALSYINRDLNAMYLNALAQKKSLPEIEAIFDPAVINEIAQKYAPTIGEVSMSGLERLAKSVSEGSRSLITDDASDTDIDKFVKEN